MGFFDFFKPKKEKELQKYIKEINKFMYPNDKKDIEAGVKELLLICENSFDENIAVTIFTRSRAMAATTQKFDKESLANHLKPYALKYFTEPQLENYYKYLMSCNLLSALQGKGPSEMRKINGEYVF